MQHSPSAPTPDVKTYLAGFALAAILTVVPFALVAADLAPRSLTLALVAVAAVIQVLVHLRFFLHVDPATTPRENLVAIAFAAAIILMMVGLSFWIIFDLHHRMMM